MKNCEGAKDEFLNGEIDSVLTLSASLITDSVFYKIACVGVQQFNFISGVAALQEHRRGPSTSAVLIVCISKQKHRHPILYWNFYRH